MSSDRYITFQKFNDAALAETIAGVLHKEDITTVVEKEEALLDATIIGTGLASTIHLKISPNCFDRANAILENFYQQQIQTMDPDYYLFSFTDDELLEIIQKPDEWGHLDHALAKKLLAGRGREITPAQLEQFHEQRLTDLKQPDTSHPILIFFGYLAAIGGGLFGLVFGSVLVSSKKILPNGQRVYMYPLSERKHGRRILVISTISFVLWLTVKFDVRLPVMGHF